VQAVQGEFNKNPQQKSIEYINNLPSTTRSAEQIASSKPKDQTSFEKLKIQGRDDLHQRLESLGYHKYLITNKVANENNVKNVVNDHIEKLAQTSKIHRELSQVHEALKDNELPSDKRKELLEREARLKLSVQNISSHNLFNPSGDDAAKQRSNVGDVLLHKLGKMINFFTRRMGKSNPELDKKHKQVAIRNFIEHLQNKEPANDEEMAEREGLLISLGGYGLSDDLTTALTYGDHSGAEWYDQDLKQFEVGLAHLTNHHNATRHLKFKDATGKEHGFFGDVVTDPTTGFHDLKWSEDEKIARQQKANMAMFKLLLAPTSFGNNPKLNAVKAFDIFKYAAQDAAAKNDHMRVFHHVPPDQSIKGEEGGRFSSKTFGTSAVWKPKLEKFFNKQLNVADPEKQSLMLSMLEQQGFAPKTVIETAEDGTRVRKLTLNVNKLSSYAKLDKLVELRDRYKTQAQKLGADENSEDDEDEGPSNVFYSYMKNRDGSLHLKRLSVKDFDLAAKKNQQIPLYDANGQRLYKSWTSRSVTREMLAHMREILNGDTYNTPERFQQFLGSDQSPELLKGLKNNVNLPYKDEEGTTANHPGAYLFGPKGGPFYLNLMRDSRHVTKDLWFSRTWNRIFGSVFGKKDKMQDVPRSNNERKLMNAAVDLVSNRLASIMGEDKKLHPHEIQAALWYYEQQLYKMMGVRVESYSYKDGIEHILKRENGELNNATPLNFKTIQPHNPADVERRKNAYAEATRTRSRADKERSQVTLAQNATKQSFAKTKVLENILRLLRSGSPIRYAQFTPVNGGMQSAPVSQRTNVPFGNAVAKQGTGKNIAHAQLNDQIAQKAGIQTSSSTAIGDWPNGSEQSTVHTSNAQVDPAKMRYLAAWHGLSGQKKSVLIFHPNEKGPDSLYHINHPETDLGKLREQLNQFNLQYKTLVPGAKGTKIMLFDPNKSNRSSIDQFATKNNLGVVENTGQGEIIGHNGDWNSAGALPKSRQAYNNIIAQYEQNQNSSGSSNNSGGTPTPAKQASTGETKKQLSKSGKAYKFNKARRILEGFLRAHNTPNKELPPVGDLLAPDLQGIKPEHMSKYQQLVPGAKWSDIEGAVSSLQQDPSLYADMTSESNRREMYCKEHARTVLHSSGVQKLLDSLVNQKLIPEHAQHLIQDAKDGDYFALEAISAELQHSIPALRSFSKAAEREYNKAGKAWDKMRSGVQKFGKKHHSAGQFRAGEHEVIMRGATYKKGQFAPQNDGKARFEKGSSKLGAVYNSINKFRGS